MRILWVTNRPIGKLAEQFQIKATSGTWMDPALEMLRQIPDMEVHIATVGNCKKMVTCQDGVYYYCLPRGRRFIYPYNKKKNLRMWKELIDSIQPDLIHIWGMEYAHGLCALKSAPGIPVVLYIQGILESVARYYFGAMSISELKRAVSLRDIIKFDTLTQQYKKYLKRAVIEKEMLDMSKNIIVENRWAMLHCQAISPNCRAYFCSLDIADVFFGKNWSKSTCIKHTLMCSAPGYPLKGLHILMKALAIVKQSIPDVVLKVPGMVDPFLGGIKASLRQSGYTKYLKKLILDLDLAKNIRFLGRLSPEQMASEMEKSHVFVVPSSIENQSSTLCEAMIVGMPCISSYVGGIPEAVRDGEDVLLYRFEEVECLADHILRVLSSEDLSQHLSQNGSRSMRNRHDAGQTQKQLLDIYDRVLEKE